MAQKWGRKQRNVPCTKSIYVVSGKYYLLPKGSIPKWVFKTVSRSGELKIPSSLWKQILRYCIVSRLPCVCAALRKTHNLHTTSPFMLRPERACVGDSFFRLYNIKFHYLGEVLRFFSNTWTCCLTLFLRKPSCKRSVAKWLHPRSPREEKTVLSHCAPDMRRR